MADSRRHFRIKERVPVRWKIKGKNVEGQGEVLNISISGVLLETDSAFSPIDDSELEIEPIEKTIDFIPPSGRLMWFRKIKILNTRFWCGLEFVKPSQEVVEKIKGKVEEAQEQMAKAANVNILQNYYV